MTQRRRILSIDGGGIYGLTSARWLRQLCEKDKTFLDGSDIWLFSGCSSGAVNALLLAQAKVPREVVLDGVLEKFWHDPGTFSNTDPFGQMLSWMELAAWFGEKDFLDLLERYFGSLTLHDLPHHVAITTFNWSGSDPDHRTHAKTPSSRGAAGGAFWQQALNRAEGFGPANAASEDSGRRWHPHIFSNVPGSVDKDFPVAEVAYGAATPPGFRVMRGGIGDAASFSANPTVDAIAFAIGMLRQRSPGKPASEVAAETLPTLSVLSLGDGTTSPFLADPGRNFGFQTWSMIPTNAATGAVYPPSSYSLQPADEEATIITRELLGNAFFRLNPGIMAMPTVVAAYMARWPSVRAWLLEQITTAADSDISRARVNAAAQFLSSPAWLDSDNKA